MSNLIPGNGKHLTLKDRTEIEVELNKGTSFSRIAKLLCKDPSTISREVLNHRLSTPNNAYNRSLNHCMLKDVCKKQHVCEKCFRTMYKGMSCKSCKRCNNTLFTNTFDVFCLKELHLIIYLKKKLNLCYLILIQQKEQVSTDYHHFNLPLSCFKRKHYKFSILNILNLTI